MGFQRNTIPDQEYKERVNSLMPDLIKNHKAESKAQIKELFFLYNDRLTPRKTKEGCGKCRVYVMSRMENLYKELNG